MPPTREPGHHQGDSIVCLFLPQKKAWHSCLLVSQAAARRREEERYLPDLPHTFKQAQTEAKV